MMRRASWMALVLPVATMLPTVAAAPVAAQEAPQPAVHELVRVAGAVWRFRSNAHYGLVMVTPAGAVVVDPLNAETAQWLKGELARRFNDLKVVEVVYSHHDWDHATGAAEFGQVPIVARVEAVKALEPPADPVERAKFLKTFAGVVPPTETYSGAVKRVTVGGHTLELHAVATSHAPDLSYVWFPAERILLTVDIISAHTMPYRTIADYRPAEFDAALDQALAFHARYIVGGHGPVGSPASILELRRYYADLRKGVADGIARGLPLDAIKQEVTLDAYRDWGDYATFREMNIEGMYKLLKQG